MDRESLRGKVQTVLGPIEPEALGATLMHEHVLCDITPPDLRGRNLPDPEITLENRWAISYGTMEHATNHRLDLMDIAISEVKELAAAGGRSLVELSCGGLDPQPEGLVRISLVTGINIVMGCGHYVEAYQNPRNAERAIEDFAKEMAAQIFHGAWGTEVRAGVIGEIGCQAPWTEQEKRVLRGALIAQQETGAAVNIHPGRDPDLPQAIAEFVIAHGGDPGRTVISHIDRTIFDADRLLRLADTGIVIEFDLFGWENAFYRLNRLIDMPNDAARLQLIRLLIDHGHLDRVVISHDICYRTRLTRFGGHGYGHIFSNVVPLMRRRGFSDAEIDTIIVDTPRCLLTIC
jgi:phosphotriesterase-related protein